MSLARGWPPALLVLVVWMAVRILWQRHSRSVRLLLYPVLALLVLASLASGYETVRGAVRAASPPEQGQLIDVGGVVGAAGRLGIGGLLQVDSGIHLRSTVDEYVFAGSSVQQAPN
ncbi:hypothetical protein [Arthrobacter sp.]|uniref:hypothetical protein n=1 Tax=Arthrobacter sp. TaxID=1667 RepID=UPI0033985796